MARVHLRLECTIDPARPVAEVCDIISSLIGMHPGKQKEILEGIRKACDDQLIKLDHTE